MDDDTKQELAELQAICGRFEAWADELEAHPLPANTMSREQIARGIRKRLRDAVEKVEDR